MQEESIRVFQYPRSIRVGYPVAFLTWALAPVLPAIIFYVLENLSGVKYTISFAKYYSHPLVPVIMAPVWLAAVYLQYIGVKSRSTIRVTSEWIESKSFLHCAKLFWSDAGEIVKRRQVFRGSELHTYFVRSNARTVIFSNRLLETAELLKLVNETAKKNSINLYCEDYEVRPIAKGKIATL